MTRTLKELLEAEKPEVSSPPAPTPVTTEKCKEQGDFSEVQNSASENLEGSPAALKKLSVNEAGTVDSSMIDLQQQNASVSESESMTLLKCDSDSLGKEGSRREKSPDNFIEFDSSKLDKKAADSTEKESSESQSYSSAKETPTEREDSREKAEMAKIPAQKVTKTAKFQSSENVSENGSMGKHTALKTCPSVGTSLESFDFKDNSSSNIGESVTMVEEAWERLKKSTVYFKGNPVGTLAAMDPIAESLNYNQV